MFAADLEEEGCDEAFPPIELKNEISTVSAIASSCSQHSLKIFALSVPKSFEWSL
jgi:hypothetical protein